MKIKKLLAAALLFCSAGAWAQTNLVAGWDGGTDTSSPSNFGWTSSDNRTMNARNASSGIRMTTTYSNYKLENGSPYTYSEGSELSSVIFWIRYNTVGESFTYTFQGLEPDTYYDFSALVGWHNNSSNPTFTIVLSDGANTMATMTKTVYNNNDKQTLYVVSATFKTPSTMTTTTDVNIVFTCNRTGDCMEALSALNLVKSSVTDLDFAKEEALALLPASAGDNFFTMPQTAIDDFTQRINEATTVDAVNGIKDEISNWAAPALSGSWNIKNVTAAGYLGTDGENVVLSEIPVAITFEKATNGFYIKAGENYINMKGNNTWSMSATTEPSTAWTFTLADGKYTIQGPNGLIGTDATTAGSYCYGDKAVGNNGAWTISEAISDEQIALTVAKNALQAALDAHPVPTANIGTGVFQYNSDDVDAMSAKVETAKAVLANETATKEELDAQTKIISAISPLILNAPAADKKYNLIVSTTAHAKEGNAVIIIPGATTANNPTGYAMNANFALNANLNQAVNFTQVNGNTYNISFETADGTTYLTYGAKNGSAAGWADWQIQATTDASNKGEFNIAASATENGFNIINTITNTTVDCQAGGNIYTEGGSTIYTLAEATKPSITVNTTAAGWGTVMLPFAANLPTGVKAYSCAAVDGIELTLESVDALEANKPYIIEGAWEETLTGDAQGTALEIPEGLLTGVYAATAAPVGSYVLQKQGEKVAFFVVEADAQPTVGANRAYLTVPAGSEVKAFVLGGNADAIQTVETETAQNGAIYNLAGQRVEKAVKGIYVINGKKVVIK